MVNFIKIYISFIILSRVLSSQIFYNFIKINNLLIFHHFWFHIHFILQVQLPLFFILLIYAFLFSINPLIRSQFASFLIIIFQSNLTWRCSMNFYFMQSLFYICHEFCIVVIAKLYFRNLQIVQICFYQNRFNHIIIPFHHTVNNK